MCVCSVMLQYNVIRKHFYFKNNEKKNEPETIILLREKGISEPKHYGQTE